MAALVEALRTVHPDLHPLPAPAVVTGEWVRWKCRYGCPRYGRGFGCPPLAPAPEETRRLLAEYGLAVLARFQPVPGPIHVQRPAWQKTVVELETRAREAGRYRALAFGFSPCTLCRRCAAEEGGTACRHPGLMRPSMEAVGIDVFATVRGAGLTCEVAPDRDCPPAHYGLLLIE